MADTEAVYDAIRIAVQSISHTDDCSGFVIGEMEEIPFAKINNYDRRGIFVRCAICERTGVAEINLYG